MGYIMSIDGGGTKLSCLIADESGNYVGRGTGGPTNSTFDSPEDIRASMEAAISEALSARGLARNEIVCLYAGLPVDPGIFHPLSVSVIHPNVNVHLCGEFRLSLFAALQSDYGGLVLSGTGSWATLRVQEGVQPHEATLPLSLRDNVGGNYIVGGWGATFGDEGSGFWIGRKTLTRFFEMSDGRRDKTVLFKAILELFQAATVDDVVRKVYPNSASKQRRVVASLCPLIGRLASEGETNCIEILENAADALATQMMVALNRAGIRQPFPITVAGGVWKCHPMVFRQFSNIVRRNFLNVTITPPLFEPVVGGILLGLRNMGYPIHEKLDDLKNEFRDFLFPVDLLGN